VKQQEIIIRDEGMRTRVMDHIAGLNLERPWVIAIGPHRQRRSLSQNALMWTWINKVAHEVHEATGQDSDAIHEFFKGQFLPRRVIKIGGVVENAPGSTKKLTKAEMSAYMDKIYAWATSEMGLLLPVPEDLGRTA
jgi:hypothetical protein